MSAPTITKGYTWASGATVTPTRLNDTVDDATLGFTQTDVIAGRETAGAGTAEEIACTAAGRALLDDASASAQRTTLGLGSVATQAASAVAFTGGSAVLDTYHANNDTVAYAGSVALDFATSVKTTQTITLAGNLTLTTANRGSGRCKFMRLVGDGSARTLTFPAGWVFLGGAAPSTLAASKTALLFLYAFGSADTDIVASYAVQS